MFEPAKHRTPQALKPNLQRNVVASNNVSEREGTASDQAKALLGIELSQVGSVCETATSSN
jgi:hypothetical protein